MIDVPMLTDSTAGIHTFTDWVNHHKLNPTSFTGTDTKLFLHHRQTSVSTAQMQDLHSNGNSCSDWRTWTRARDVKRAQIEILYFFNCTCESEELMTARNLSLQVLESDTRRTHPWRSHRNEHLKSLSCLIQLPAENKRRMKTACDEQFWILIGQMVLILLFQIISAENPWLFTAT